MQRVHGRRRYEGALNARFAAHDGGRAGSTITDQPRDERGIRNSNRAAGTIEGRQHLNRSGVTDISNLTCVAPTVAETRNVPIVGKVVAGVPTGRAPRTSPTIDRSQRDSTRGSNISRLSSGLRQVARHACPPTVTSRLAP